MRAVGTSPFGPGEPIMPEPIDPVFFPSERPPPRRFDYPVGGWSSALGPEFYAEQRRASVLAEFVRARAAGLDDTARRESLLRLIDGCFDRVDVTPFGGPDAYVLGAVRSLATLEALAAQFGSATAEA